MAERVLGAKHKNNILTVTHYQRCSFCWKESVQKGGFFFPTQSSRSYLDKLPIEVGNYSITLLCCVHPDGGGGDDKATMTHH